MSATTPWQGGQSLIRGGLAAGAAGFVACGIGLVIEPRQALFSFLVAYVYAMTLLVGALLLLMAIHAANAEWPTIVRRLLESVVGALPLLAVFFLPIALGAGRIYCWAGAEPVSASVRHAIEHKGSYLSVPFFEGRSCFYLVSWLVTGELLRAWSLRQDHDGGPEWGIRQWKLSGFGLVVLGLTFTFASFDWIMSLTPDWKSSVYGVYVFAGGFLGALSLLAVLMNGVQRSGAFADELRPAHFVSTGKLMLAFTIFWVYQAYCQYFIIWIADLPVETSWWMRRIQGWAVVSLVLICGGFIVPFAALLSRGLKEHPDLLAAVALWILAFHYLDIYWLVMPALHKDGPHPSWLDGAALLLVLGFTVAFAAWRARGEALVPVGDPRLRLALEYEGS